MSEQSSAQQDENRLIAERRAKLDAIRRERNAFPNDFRREHYAADLQRDYAGHSRESCACAGRSS